MQSIINRAIKWQRRTLVTRLLSYEINTTVHYIKPNKPITPLLVFELPNRKKGDPKDTIHNLSFAILEDLSLVQWSSSDAEMEVLCPFTPLPEAVGLILKKIAVMNLSYTFCTALGAWKKLVQQSNMPLPLPFTTRNLKMKAVERKQEEISNNSYIETSRALQKYLAHALIHETSDLKLEALHNNPEAMKVVQLSKTTKEVYQLSEMFLSIQTDMPRIRLGKFLRLDRNKEHHKITREDLQFNAIAELPTYSDELLYDAFIMMSSLTFAEIVELTYDNIKDELPYWFNHSIEEISDAHEGLNYFKIKMVIK